ncbi:fungal-specific transcription factor domain-containing protein [Lipomyces japonicus]|uniref:fungal-specific transcription factor domain-containing protein n=1 Tax=Lipomyces japonicus TaxID=56871 RepID=UPI0034CD2951
MFVVQTTHSKTGLKRPDRPCDACRRRKSRCVFSENDSVCFLCRFHNYECVFSENPPPRKRQRRNSTDQIKEGRDNKDSNSKKDKNSKDAKKDDDNDKLEKQNQMGTQSSLKSNEQEPEPNQSGRTIRTGPGLSSAVSQPPVSSVTSSSPIPSLQSMSSVLSLNIGHDKKDGDNLAAVIKKAKLKRSNSRKASSSTSPASNITPPAQQIIQSAPTPDSPFPDYDFLPHSLLRNTLGLQCRKYISYIGTSAEHDPVLMNYYSFDNRDRVSLPAVGPDFQTKRQVRRVQLETSSFPKEQVSFVVFESENLFQTGHPNPSGRDDTIGGNLIEVSKIQELIGKFGRQLVGLYFRIVHPSLPILHKQEFLEKFYRNPSELSPSLLAGLYVFAINWWTYDPDLVPFPRPTQSALEALAQINLYREIDRPTLSTVQAGILLLQHQTFRNQVTRPSHSWAMLGEVIAIAQEVGLHLDPSQWSIPEWERGLRKRLAWGLYIQDKWMALTCGRPSYIHKINWIVPEINDDNFPDDEITMTNDEESDDPIYSASMEGSVNRETGKIMFIQLIALTQILSDILDEFHSASSMNDFYSDNNNNNNNSSSNDCNDEQKIKKLLSKARPLQIRLKDWLEQLPECLRMENITRGELSANGNLHLAYHAAQIALFRPILRALSKIDRDQSMTMYEIYGMVYRSAFAEFISAVEFVNNLKPQHIQTFWYAASKNNFAIIVTFGTLLMMTASTDAERAACLEKLSEFQWTLKINVHGADFLQHAILWTEECKHLLKNYMTKKNGRSDLALSKPADVSHQQQEQQQQQKSLANVVPVQAASLRHLQPIESVQAYATRMQPDMTSMLGGGGDANNVNEFTTNGHMFMRMGQTSQFQNSQDHDAFFTSLVTDGRANVINHALNSNGRGSASASTSATTAAVAASDDLDNLEFIHMRMVSHAWAETKSAESMRGASEHDQQRSRDVEEWM